MLSLPLNSADDQTEDKKNGEGHSHPREVPTEELKDRHLSILCIELFQCACLSVRRGRLLVEKVILAHRRVGVRKCVFVAVDADFVFCAVFVHHGFVSYLTLYRTMFFTPFLSVKALPVYTQEPSATSTVTTLWKFPALSFSANSGMNDKSVRPRTSTSLPG